MNLNIRQSFFLRYKARHIDSPFILISLFYCKMQATFNQQLVVLRPFVIYSLLSIGVLATILDMSYKIQVATNL